MMPIRPAVLRPVLVLLAVLACAFVVAGMRIDQSTMALFPAGGELGRQAAFFESRAAARLLAVEIGGDPVAADAFVRERLLPAVTAHGARPALSRDPTGARLVRLLRERLPVLVTPEELDAWSSELEARPLEERLRGIAAFLRRPGNELAAAAVCADPLGWSGRIATALDRQGGGEGRRGPCLVHADGRHLLLPLRVSFPPEDERRTTSLLDSLEAERPAASEAGLTLAVVGSYRHYEDNRSVLQADLWHTLPLSLLILGLIMASLFRSPRALLLLVLPPLVGTAVGLALVVLLGGFAVNGVVLGFLPVLLGIAVDYGVHMVRAGRDGSADRVRRPLIVGYATAAAAFAVLLPGGFPLLHRLAVLVIAGLAGALLTTLYLLPPLARGAKHRRDPWAAVGRLVLSQSVGHPRRNLALAIGITLLLVPGLFALRLQRDLRAMDGSRPETRRELAAVQGRWGRQGGNDFLVASGATTDVVLRDLERARAEYGLPLPPLLRFHPSGAERERRLAAWNAFWKRFGPAFRRDLAAAAVAAGLRDSAFAPALAVYAPAPASLAAEPPDWSGTAIAALVDRRLERTATAWRAAVPVTVPGGDAAVMDLAAELAPEDGAWLASRRVLARTLVEGIGRDLLGRLGFILAAVLVTLAVTVRRPRRVVAIALTPVLALTWTYGAFGWLGVEIGALHVLVATFVAGIGIDDAVFLSRVDLRRGAIEAILLTTLTTCAGAGILLLAAHPAVAAIGLSVFTGMTACLAACLLTCHAIAGGQDGQQEGQERRRPQRGAVEAVGHRL